MQFPTEFPTARKSQFGGPKPGLSQLDVTGRSIQGERTPRRDRRGPLRTAKSPCVITPA
jgi:hypothetical protein